MQNKYERLKKNCKQFVVSDRNHVNSSVSEIFVPTTPPPSHKFLSIRQDIITLGFN